MDKNKGSEKPLTISSGEALGIVAFEDTKKPGMQILPLFTRKEIVSKMFKPDESVLWMDGRVILGLVESAKYNVAINPGVALQKRIENSEVSDFNRREGISPSLKAVK